MIWSLKFSPIAGLWQHSLPKKKKSGLNLKTFLSKKRLFSLDFGVIVVSWQNFPQNKIYQYTFVVLCSIANDVAYLSTGHINLGLTSKSTQQSKVQGLNSMLCKEVKSDF